MIDKEQFVAGMTAISAAFGREVDGATQRMYFGILNPKLTTDEFNAAILETCSTETFWPAPAVILGKVPRLKQDAGVLALSHVNRVMGQHGGFRALSYDTYQREFDAPTQKAILAVGGLAKISATTEEHWSGLQKRFAAAYSEAVNGSPPPSGRVTETDRMRLAAGDRGE